MGGVCDKPQCDGEGDLVVQPGKDGRGLSKAALSQAQAQELISIPGAEVVLIGSGGEEVPVRKGALALVKVEKPSQLTVLSVGDSKGFEDRFCYPLLPETPVCLSGGCVFTVSAGDGDVFGIRLPKPANQEGQLQELIELLSRACALQVQAEPDFADRVVGRIVAGSKQLVSGVEMVTERVSQGIRKGGNMARARVGQADEEVKVGQATKVGVAGARFVTGSAVAIASSVVDGLMDTAVMIGQEASKARGDSDPNAKEGTALKVGRAVGTAGLQVFDSLVRAGDRLVEEGCDEAAATVGHRYGQDAGEVTRDGLGTVVDAKQVYDMFGKKAVTRLAAKASLYTAKGMMEGHSAAAAAPQGKAKS